MIVWINGAFGVGKTTAARRMRELEPAWRLFDPEYVGYLLRALLDGVAFDDFQDLPGWRSLVPAVAHEVIMHTGDDLIAVQTVLRRDYWQELRAGFADRAIAVKHVLLDAEADTLRDRITADTNERTAAQWRLDHIDAYAAARDWLLADADLVVDTKEVAPDAIATTILAASSPA